MISVIIPLMPVKPYSEQVKDCVRDIENQTADTEILVIKQEISDHINKCALLNEGFRKATGEYIWHCDADFLLPNKDFLQSMLDKMEDDNLDVIYPMFYSRTFKQLKITDGGPFMRRKILEDYRLNDTLLGVSYVTFPLLDHCLKKRFHCSKEFVVGINYRGVKVASEPKDPKRKRLKVGIQKKKHVHTLKKTVPIVKRLIPELQAMGVWP